MLVLCPNLAWLATYVGCVLCVSLSRLVGGIHATTIATNVPVHLHQHLLSTSRTYTPIRQNAPRAYLKSLCIDASLGVLIGASDSERPSVLTIEQIHNRDGCHPQSKVDLSAHVFQQSSEKQYPVT